MGSRAVILAGGRGQRLQPFTAVLPKPLLPVGDRAILEILIDQLRHFGFTELTIAVGYLSHLIQAVLGDGSERGVSIVYHHEDEPLGTAGPLATIEGLDEPFLVLNGDLLTTLDFRALLEDHRASGNVMTVAAHRRVVETNYGVLHLEGTPEGMRPITGWEEKPSLQYVVSMGVYALSPEALAPVPANEAYDVPQLVVDLMGAGKPVGAYVSSEYWLDIGRHDDYEQANAQFESMRDKLWPTD